MQKSQRYGHPMLASIGIVVRPCRIPRTNAEARISGMRSSTVGTSSNGRALEITRAGIEAAGQDVGHKGLVAFLHHEIEEAQAIHRERLGVGSADHGPGAGPPVEPPERIGDRARLRVGGDEHDIEVAREEAVRIAGAVVGRVEGLVARRRHHTEIACGVTLAYCLVISRW